MVALQVLTTTQTFFHDLPEALDGIRIAWIAIIIETAVFYFLVLQTRAQLIDRDNVIFVPSTSAEIESEEGKLQKKAQSPLFP